MSSEADAEAAWALVQENPRNHAAWHFLAVTAVQSGRADLAIDYAERAHRLDRKNAEYLGILGVALAEAGRLDEAIEALARAVKLQPGRAEARSNLAHALKKARRIPEALDAYSRACAIDPRRADIKSRYASLLLQSGKCREALELLRSVHLQVPDDAEAAVELANAISDSEGVESAIAFLEAQLQRTPGDASLRFRLSQSLLLVGEWERGWREYMFRPSALRAGNSAAPAPLPVELSGSTVLLLPNQGLGDMLFFLRFAPEIKLRNGRAIFRAPAKLAGLLRQSASAFEVVEHDVAHHVAFGVSDLPYMVQARDVQPPVRLEARADKKDAWRERIRALGQGPYIGITWRAGTDPASGPEFGGGPAELLFKEVDIKLLAPALKDIDATLISLQRLPIPRETEALAALAGRQVHDLSAVNEDLEEMTAVLSLLDDYIGVSNTNTHIRAGLGLGGKMLAPFPPEWRWMAQGTQSPWFPGFRIYRQTADRDWTAALHALREDSLRRA